MMRLKSFFKKIRFWTKGYKNHREERFSEIPLIRASDPAGKRLRRSVFTRTRLLVLLAFLSLIGALFSQTGTDWARKWLQSKNEVIPLTVKSRIIGPIPLIPGISKSEYPHPPPVQIGAESTLALERDAMSVQLGKVRLYQEGALPYIQQEEIEVQQTRDGRRLLTELDMAQLIGSRYEITPHGWYRMEITLADRTSPHAYSTEWWFNYVYREDFRKLHEVLVPRDEGFTSIVGHLGGLMIHNQSDNEGFISADLVQVFDFRTNFIICGFFTVEYQDISRPSGLDFVICDERGQIRASIILADGHLNGFVIKTGNERIGDKDVKVRSETTSVRRSTEIETVRNYFKVCVRQQAAGHLIQVFLTPEKADFGVNSLAHQRLIEDSRFYGSFTTIKIRLWKAGIVKLYDFTVAEEIPNLRKVAF